jgi:signal transduction histidine kinase
MTSPPTLPPPPTPASLPSIRTELLVKLALLTAAAILLAVASVTLLYDVISPEYGALYISTIVAADVTVFLLFGTYLVQHLVVHPLRAAVSAAEAIAAGDLRRRVPPALSRELQNLAVSFNHMTDRLLEEQAQLVRAEKLASVGRLAAGVAHEIGNPLGAINGYVHVLRSRLADVMDRNDVAEALTALERESARIDRIVRGLLEYARPRPPAPTPIDVNDVARSVIELLTLQGVLKGLDVSLELSREELYVHGERHDLEQLFVNLLLNAADAMDKHGRLIVRIERTARIALRQPSVRRSLASKALLVEHPPSARAQLWLAGHDAAEIAKIVVADSGPGVAPELTERIFDPFFTTKQPGKGTGLGLAIVARIVENFHGTIWVTSAREGGAAFHILFPLAPTIVGDRRFTPPIARARALAK